MNNHYPLKQIFTAYFEFKNYSKTSDRATHLNNVRYNNLFLYKITEVANLKRYNKLCEKLLLII